MLGKASAEIFKLYPIPKDYPEKKKIVFKIEMDCQKLGVKVGSSFENEKIREAMQSIAVLFTDFTQGQKDQPLE